MADTVNPDAEMIDVVLMRHGEAQALAGTDAARPLTQWGRDAVQAAAAALAKKAPSAQGVRSSPYLRARQTAEIVSEVLNLPILPESVEMVPSGDSDHLAAWLLAEGQPVIWVFHMPIIGHLIRNLTGREVFPKTASIFGLKVFPDAQTRHQHHLEWQL